MNVEEITLDVVDSYATACRDLHTYIKLLQADGFELLVVPSRGAHPFLHAAKGYSHRSQLAQSGATPTLLEQYPEELYLPFTADISEDQPISSSSIRHFWSRVLSAILLRNENDVAHRFYRFARSKAGSLAVGRANISKRFGGKFIFLDTVVSGRAISEIFAAFESYGLTDCHFILLIDERGKRLRSEYSRKIDSMVQSGRATTIFVEKIFTEDQGPAMSGIWTVTMPDFALAAQRMIPELHQSGEIAATLFYWEVRRRDDGSNTDITVSNAHLGTLLFSAVNDSANVTSRFLEEFRAHVSAAKLQRQSVTQAIANPLIFENLNVDLTDVSSSHVIRAFIDQQKAEKLVQEFLDSSHRISAEF